MSGSRVLVTFAGRKSYVVDALYQSAECADVVTVDADPEATVRFHSRASFETVPLVREPEAYLSALEEVAARHQVDAILPVNDTDAPILSAARQRFLNAGVRVLVPEQDMVRTLLDKRAAYDWFRAEGFSTPPTWTRDEAITAALPEALVTKPRRGSGSRGFRVLAGPTEVGGLPEDHLVQERVVGRQLDLDILKGGGRVLSVIPKVKLSSSDGTCDRAVAIDSNRAIELGRRLGDAIAFEGSIDVDVVEAEDTLYVLEVNPRLGGCFPFSALLCPQFVDGLLRVARGAECMPFIGTYRRGVVVHRTARFFEGSPDRDPRQRSPDGTIGRHRTSS